MKFTKIEIKKDDNNKDINVMGSNGKCFFSLTIHELTKKYKINEFAVLENFKLKGYENMMHNEINKLTKGYKSYE